MDPELRARLEAAVERALARRRHDLMIQRLLDELARRATARHEGGR